MIRAPFLGLAIFFRETINKKQKTTGPEGAGEGGLCSSQSVDQRSAKDGGGCSGRPARAKVEGFRVFRGLRV